MQAALIREAQEELGITIAATLGRRSHQLRAGKCDDLRWFPLDALPKPMVPYIRHAIDSDRAGQTAKLNFYGW